MTISRLLARIADRTIDAGDEPWESAAAALRAGLCLCHGFARQDSWLHLVAKGAKAGKVALPPLALAALERYLG